MVLSENQLSLKSMLENDFWGPFLFHSVGAPQGAIAKWTRVAMEHEPA